ncbi:MAG: 3D domain-containing protein [bacterium]|nr:3D domain-containing protein [bacterium]
MSSIAFAQQINSPRYRITVTEEKKVGWFSAIGDAFSKLQMSTVGYLSPKVGQKFKVTAVAYSPTVDQNDASPCITASGTVVRKGVVATNFLPIGTRLKIGNDFYTVEDRMNAKYNGVKIIDIWHPTTKEAIAFGAKKLEIEILPKDFPATPAPNPNPLASKQLSFWERTKSGVQSMGSFLSDNLPTRTYMKEADCSKLLKQQQ